MTDFWLSCGHHLLDRDEGGGLKPTDDFLKVYLARPELIPPPEFIGGLLNPARIPWSSAGFWAGS